MDDLLIQVTHMRLLRKQVLNARAVFVLQVGPVRLHDCFVIGQLETPYSLLTIALPGKRDRTDSSWRTLAYIEDPDLLHRVTEKALVEYQRLCEPEIDRIAKHYGKGQDAYIPVES